MEFFIVLSFPILQALMLQIVSGLKKQVIAQVALCSAVLTFLGTVVAIILVFWHGSQQIGPFWFDRFSVIVMGLISLIALMVNRFSIQYMQIDGQYGSYFKNLACLTATLLCFVCAGNIYVMTLAWWGMSFFMLTLLRHQNLANASRNAANYAQQVFWMGDAAFLMGAILFSIIAKTASLPMGMQALAHTSHQVELQLLALLWLFAGLTKTANLPFYRWLPNTMASPTPVSAMMHAGFINSGGILFARFSGLYVHCPNILFLMFAIGALTAVFGSIAMLVQTDIKRYLAYSTVGQMGFMVMQCGLGIFPAAIFHLLAHSLFKSSLFLGSGGVIQNTKDVALPNPNFYASAKLHSSIWTKETVLIFLLTIPVMFFVAYGLNFYTGFKGASSFLLLFPGLAMMGLTQNVLHKKALRPLYGWLSAMVISVGLIVCYAFFENGTHWLLGADVLMMCVPFTLPHLLIMVLCLAIILVMMFRQSDGKWTLAVYMWLLNCSNHQANPTLFTHRRRKLFVHE